MRDLDFTKEIEIRNDLGINKYTNDNTGYYHYFNYEYPNSLLVYGNDEMIGEYHLDLLNNDCSKISFSVKKDNNIKFYEFKKQDDYFSLYYYKETDDKRILSSGKTVSDNFNINNEAEYSLSIFKGDKENNFPFAGYTLNSSKSSIINHARDNFRVCMPMLQDIINCVKYYNNCDINDFVFNSLVVNEINYNKIKRKIRPSKNMYF